MQLNNLIISAILAATSLASPLAQSAAEPAADKVLEKRVTHYGTATFYEQQGAAGSCGTVHADSDKIIALSPSWQGSGYPPAYCGRKIQITNDGGGQNNNGKGKVVVATVADTCPGCSADDLANLPRTWLQYPIFTNADSAKMSFLKKYKKQFEDAKEKYMPEEKKAEEKAAPSSEHAPSSAAVPEQTQNLTPAVPPGWTANWDTSQNHWTYHEQATGKTQLEHPDPANYAGQSMPPGGPVLEKDGKPKKDKNGMLIGAAGGLATGAFGKKLMGHAKKKAMKQAGMGGHKSHGGHGGGHGGGESGSESSSGGGSD
ncbi:MAG: hypothetical protein Q9220_006373 [cf. Caloplaca sp. 1 TL-2023]